MEYEFRRDFITGAVAARFSMGHEVLGLWLEQELSAQPENVETVLLAIETLQTGNCENFQLNGTEYSLFLNREEAKVTANLLLQSEPNTDRLDEEDLHFYDQESLSLCGLEDFQIMLDSWRQFIQKDG